MYFNQAPDQNLFGQYTHVEPVHIPQPRLWTHTACVRNCSSGHLTVFFTPAHVIPVAYGGPSVATVHDLGYEFFPEAHTTRQRTCLRWSTQHNCRVGIAVIADSEATGTDLVRLYDIPSTKINVVYPGADPELGPEQDPERISATLARYGIRSPYVLYLGTLQPRKNLVRLVDAFAAGGLARSGYTLVLAGKPGWLSEPVLSAVAALDQETAAAIQLPGYIDEPDSRS
ncbi:MAG: glycosyltransferase [Chloroflexota bacterium]